MNMLIPHYPADKELFPAYHEDAQAWRESTTFFNDFKIAEAFGLGAIKDTFNRAFKSWQKSPKYLCELCAVCNHLCWEWHNRNDVIGKYYSDCYYKCYDLIFKTDEEGNNASPFSDEDVAMIYKVLD